MTKIIQMSVVMLFFALCRFFIKVIFLGSLLDTLDDVMACVFEGITEVNYLNNC